MKRKTAKDFLSPTNTPRKVINRVAIVLDESGSMGHLAAKVVTSVERQIESLVNGTLNEGQQTIVSVVKFDDRISTVIREHDITARTFRPEAMNYQPLGGTRLYDAIAHAVNELEAVPVRPEEDVAYLVVIITDGQENRSQNWTRTGFSYGDSGRSFIDHLILTKQDAGVWSFVVAGPIGCKRLMEAINIPTGNITEWEQTDAGVQYMTQSNAQGLNNYTVDRSRGQTMSCSFYTDMSDVTPTALKQLIDLSGAYKRWKVDRECRIDDFIGHKSGATYVKGSTFYELTKREYVQDNKAILVEDRATKQIYGGDDARGLIKMPSAAKVTVHPGNHANYRIFVQSKSDNRKLVRGTFVLWDGNAK